MESWHTPGWNVGDKFCGPFHIGGPILIVTEQNTYTGGLKIKGTVTKTRLRSYPLIETQCHEEYEHYYPGPFSRNKEDLAIYPVSQRFLILDL